MRNLRVLIRARSGAVRRIWRAGAVVSLYAGRSLEWAPQTKRHRSFPDLLPGDTPAAAPHAMLVPIGAWLHAPELSTERPHRLTAGLPAPTTPARKS